MKDPGCLFCKIVARQIPSDIVYEDDTAIAIRDIHPKAPVHLLVMPRVHLVSLATAGAEEMPLIAHLVQVAALLAVKEHIADRGYRVVINSGEEGDQAIPHLHLHLLGGRHLSGGIA